jgi:hypothetical protein
MIEACPADKLKPALNTLLMYFRNLAKEPQVPRYGRIARTNAAYTKALGDVPHHQEFLAAHGFEDRAAAVGAARSPTLEWSEEWRNNADAWAVKVLKDSIKNLEAVVNAPQAPATGATVSANVADLKLEQAEATFLAKEVDAGKGEPSRAEQGKTTPVPVKAAARPAALFAAAPFQVPGALAAAAPAPAAPAPAAPAPAAPAPAAPAPAAPATATTALSSAAPAPAAPAPVPQDENKYPLSYAEVMKMVKEGKEPPGIKKIPASLSMDADNPSKPALQPLPKPWERVPDPSVGHDRAGTPQAKDQSATYNASLFTNDNGEEEEELQRGVGVAHLLPVGSSGVEFEELSG